MNGQNSINSTIPNIASSFVDIVNSKQRMVYNTALGIVQNEADAEDITQEVFVKVYQNLENFRNEANVATWIYRITITTALDFEKQKTRQKRGGLLKRVFGETEVEEAAHFEHPGVALDKKEDAAVLFKAMKKLPTNQRTAFLLHKLEGLTNNEIAAIMNISLQAAESLQIRAKNNLRNYLKDYYEKHFK
ncbi:RNA polymerase sigma factor [Ferruginibacter yonginensis]|uniref:RNA polymerase sigma factor n=1 Tax=Ferruginibacter yonginensis TaxID=1310416 RepID=A0ABV8QSG6_9BACT